MSEEEKISMNVIRSADEDQEIVEESMEAILEGVAGSTTDEYSTEGIAITVMNDHPKTTEGRPVSTDKTAKTTISPTTDALPSLESSDSELQVQEKARRAGESLRSHNGGALPGRHQRPDSSPCCLEVTDEEGGQGDGNDEHDDHRQDGQ